MRELRDVSREAAEDIFFGQVVSIWARRFVIAAAALTFVWGADSAGELGGAIGLIVVLMAANFHLHGHYLIERPANPALLMAAGVVDLIVISVIVGVWDVTGPASPYFILHYPVEFAFALVFPPRPAAVFTGMAVSASNPRPSRATWLKSWHHAAGGSRRW
jgi:hypothetical protein